MHCKYLPVVPYKALENFSKALYGTTGGTYSACIIRPVMFVLLETLLCIYNAFVQPRFDYCSVLWGNCNKSLSIKLQKLQNRAARV